MPSFHLILVESGKLIAHGGPKPIEAQTGDLVCFYPTNRNRVTIGAGMEWIQMHLEFAPPPQHQMLPWLDDAGPFPRHTPLGHTLEPARRAFEAVCLELSRSGAAARLRTSSAVFDILALVATIRAGRALPQHLDPWQRLRWELQGRLNERVSVTQVARRMNLSPAYFIRQFHKRFGVSPLAYHLQARLQEAARLLRAGDEAIKTVGYRVGFRNSDTFTRAFRRHFGVTPSDVRGSTVSLAEPQPTPSPNMIALNHHIVPPGTPSDFMHQFDPQGSGGL